MISFGMIMGNEILQGGPQRFLTEEDHPAQTGLLDAAVQIAPRRRSD
jgi:hypothetical protein